MTTADVEQVPQDWDEILRWVVAGEEVQLTEHDKVVARLVPQAAVPTPDFLARAQTIWSEHPEGKSVGAIVSEAREGTS